MQTITRRPRYARQSTGKRIELQPRDIEVFKLLQRYRYLRSTFLHAFLGGDEDTFKHRLGDLYHDGRYINRPKQQWDHANARYHPAIYELDYRGAEVLRYHGLQEEDISDLVRRGRMGAIRQFPHGMMICDTLASIELALRDKPTLRFISWQEIIDRAPEKVRMAKNPFAIPVRISHTFSKTGTTEHKSFGLVPDGLFGLEYNHDGEKSYRFFALEAERKNRIDCSNLNQTSWLKKVLAYRHITAHQIYKTHLGLPNLMILVVTPTQARVERMKRMVLAVTEDRGSNIFLFGDIPTLGYSFQAPKPMPKLLTGSWQRAGKDDFYINQP